MHLNIKKITAGIVILAIIIFALSYGAFATQNIKILIDGQELSYSKTAVIENEVPLVPMRKIFEALGAEVLWDGENRSVTAIYNSDVITVFPDDGSIIKNGELIDTQIKPAIIDNSVVVPVHIISQCFGKNVLWNGRDCTVSISQRNMMKTSFFSCGQADCMFIELPDGKCMLVDAGESSFGEKLENHIRNAGYSYIDYVVATHPHADHIGGMAHILSNFEVGTFYMPDKTHTTKTFEKMMDALRENGCERKLVFSGDVIAEGIYDITVLSPLKYEYQRMNNYSVVLKISYGDVSMLLSADAEVSAETDMLEAGLDLDSDILKVGHHGSSTSTTQKYLDAISPDDAIISVGEDNSHGVPSTLVMAYLQSRGINIHSTYEKGDINVSTDGYIYVVD